MMGQKKITHYLHIKNTNVLTMRVDEFGMCRGVEPRGLGYLIRCWVWVNEDVDELLLWVGIALCCDVCFLSFRFEVELKMNVTKEKRTGVLDDRIVSVVVDVVRFDVKVM
jgi:hypothetical protein